MKETNRVYWIGVGKRFFGLVRKAISKSIPIAVTVGIDKACSVINCKLREIYKNSIVNALITLALNGAGLLSVIYYPFGIVLSRCLGAALFITSIVWSCVRFAKYLRKYGQETISVCKNVLSQKSVSRGIENYVYFRFPMIMFVYVGIDMTANYYPPLREIPSLNKTIKFFIKVFWKQILVYTIIMFVYFFTVYWIIKPILLNSFANTNLSEICFYPILYLFDFFFEVGV